MLVAMFHGRCWSRLLTGGGGDAMRCDAIAMSDEGGGRS